VAGAWQLACLSVGKAAGHKNPGTQMQTYDQ
jgi:hypothetical protein